MASAPKVPGNLDAKALVQSPRDLLGGMFTWNHAVGYAVGTALTDNQVMFRENWALWLGIVLLLNALFVSVVVGTQWLRLLKEDGAESAPPRIAYMMLVTVRLTLGWANVTIFRNVVVWTLESHGFMGMLNIVMAVFVLYSLHVFLNPLPPNALPPADGRVVPDPAGRVKAGTVPVENTLSSLTHIDHTNTPV